MSVETNERFLLVDGSGKRVVKMAFDENYKISLIRTLTYRCLRICSSPCLVLSAITSYADVLRLVTRNHQRTEVTSPLSRQSWGGTRDKSKNVCVEGYVCYSLL